MINITKDKLSVEKVVEQLQRIMDKSRDDKLTGQVSLELNYSCGGLSKVYILTKTAVK